MEEKQIPILQIEDASIVYGKHLLLSGFCLHVDRGEMVCLSGPSGCGKSSLLNAVLGFCPLERGRILLNGVRLERTTVDQLRKQIAWIPQELALPMEWVREMVQLPFELKANRGIPFSEERLFACFEALGLERSLYRKRVSEVSGGQRQRLMIAVAALMEKPLLMVDEPTSALDACATERVLAFMRQQAVRGCGILAVSHDESFAAGCDRHILMNHSPFK